MEKTLARNEMDLRSQSGFTLLEMMSVLVILGVVFSITIHRFTALSDTSYQKALELALRELNVRETLIWTDFKISSDGWENDDDVFLRLDTKLGGGYHWSPAASKLGGALHFGPISINLIRNPSSTKKAGSWQIH